MMSLKFLKNLVKFDKLIVNGNGGWHYCILVVVLACTTVAVVMMTGAESLLLHARPPNLKWSNGKARQGNRPSEAKGHALG
jgi:hypothetical protein